MASLSFSEASWPRCPLARPRSVSREEEVKPEEDASGWSPSSSSEDPEFLSMCPELQSLINGNVLDDHLVSK